MRGIGGRGGVRFHYWGGGILISPITREGLVKRGCSKKERGCNFIIFLSVCGACVLYPFTQFLLVFFAFHRKDLVLSDLISRYVALI